MGNTEAVPLRNRVDPFGDLAADPGRGLFTGNRGCLVDADGAVVRHHRSSLWITCVLSFRGRRHPLTAPRIWTPLFFLDDAVALAAGHRPCGECRRADYRAYQAAVTAAIAADRPVRALELNRRLAGERLRRGSGVDRAGDRRLWTAHPLSLPAGTVVVSAGVPHLLTGSTMLPFSFAGWGPAVPVPSGDIDVLTPPTSVLALANGFVPRLHPTATSADRWEPFDQGVDGSSRSVGAVVTDGARHLR